MTVLAPSTFVFYHCVCACASSIDTFISYLVLPSSVGIAGSGICKAHELPRMFASSQAVHDSACSTAFVFYHFVCARASYICGCCSHLPLVTVYKHTYVHARICKQSAHLSRTFLKTTFKGRVDFYVRLHHDRLWLSSA